METLVAQGDAAEALRVYEGLRGLLRDELGAAPSGELAGAPTRPPRKPAPRFPKGEAARLRRRDCIPGREDPMAWMIRCECGEVARAENDDEVVAAVERHISEQHPEMVGRLSREQILGMAEVV
jgi:hypothetical protein